jgi:hypothetical protein
LQKLMDLAKKPLSVQETWETRYEQLMEQFASDMRLYMGMVRADHDLPGTLLVMHSLVDLQTKSCWSASSVPGPEQQPFCAHASAARSQPVPGQY